MTLKTRGPQGIAAIAEVLDVTAEAVRQQMARLQVEGLVDAETRSAGRGRPTQIWRLTQAGHARLSRHARRDDGADAGRGAPGLR
ncbi:transcriptional regulator, PadR domain protein [Bordetella pertussis STO1-CHOC-0017]|nr:transcriptional regulator, PadR domain protein [Bordetella pertussis STO1-CHOC-0017]